jgi:NTP pyrophosphatase (non-canonical NTP hydrolase)
MKSDSSTTVQELKRLLRRFRDERDWEQFHDLKNLAEAISVEASELLELFLWKNSPEIKRSAKSDRRLRKAMHEELADVFCFCLNFANSAEIDVTQAVRSKLETNKKRYPIAKARGVATKYDKL